MSLRDIIRLGRENCEARILLVEVSYVDGNPETYVLPVAIASGEGARAIRQDHPQAVIAQFADDGVQAVLFDAIYDAQFRSLLLDVMVRQEAVRGQEGTLQGEVARILSEKVSAVDSMSSTILKAEQSNTSAIYGGEWFFKLYRRLEDGINPEVEVTRFLTERAGFPNVPPFGGAIAYRRQGETAPRMLCIVQQLVQNQGDAWTLTLGVVGQYLEQVLAGKDVLPALKLPPIGMGDGGIEFPREFLHALGTAYPERVRQLGQRTAEMHLALRCDRSDPAFAPESFSAHYQRSVYQSMRNGVRRTFQSLGRRAKYLPEDIRREVEVMLGREREILERIARVLRRKIPAEKIRIHGDYHLGQVLDTGRDFIIIDFEGEPARPISERRLKRSALRDVAGMLRSFHYAAQTALAQQFSVRGVDVPTATPWVDLWVDAVSRAFLESYLATAGNASFLPRDRGDLAVLLEVYLLDKAVYEVGYELNNRPDWIRVPLRGIARILDA